MLCTGMQGRKWKPTKMPADILRTIKLTHGPEDLSDLGYCEPKALQCSGASLPATGVCPLMMKKIVTRTTLCQVLFSKGHFCPSFSTSEASSKEEPVKENQLPLWGTISTTNQARPGGGSTDLPLSLAQCAEGQEVISRATQFLYRVSSSTVSHYKASPYTLYKLICKLGCRLFVSHLYISKQKQLL